MDSESRLLWEISLRENYVMEWHMHEMGTVAWAYLLFLLLIIAVAAIFVARRTWDGSKDDEAPLDILKKRYARGDISKEEFARMKKDICEEEP